MANNGSDTIKITAPYIPCQTLVAFVEQLKSSALPPRIDSSIMHGKSGAMQTGLKTAMKFLGLTDAQGHVTKQMRDLVAAYGTESWKDTLGNLIIESFNPYVGDLDLDAATSAQLRDTLRGTLGIDGQMLDKAVRFYLTGLDEAGITYSPHFRKAARATRSAASKRKATKRPRDPSEDENRVRDGGGGGTGGGGHANQVVVPEGFISHPFQLRRDLMIGVVLPNDLSRADVERLTRWLATLPIE